MPVTLGPPSPKRSMSTVSHAAPDPTARNDISGNENATRTNSNMGGHEIRRVTKVDIGICLSRVQVNIKRIIMHLRSRPHLHIHTPRQYIIIYFI